EVRFWRDAGATNAVAAARHRPNPPWNTVSGSSVPQRRREEREKSDVGDPAPAGLASSYGSAGGQHRGDESSIQLSIGFAVGARVAVLRGGAREVPRGPSLRAISSGAACADRHADEGRARAQPVARGRPEAKAAAARRQHPRSALFGLDSRTHVALCRWQHAVELRFLLSGGNGRDDGGDAMRNP